MLLFQIELYFQLNFNVGYANLNCRYDSINHIISAPFSGVLQSTDCFRKSSITIYATSNLLKASSLTGLNVNTPIQARTVELRCFKSFAVTPKNCHKTRCIGYGLVNLNYKFLALLFYHPVRALYFVGYSSTLKECMLVCKQNKSDTKGSIDRSLANQRIIVIL